MAPGRWNQRGERMVYTAGSLSLAVLELFVHLEPEDLPDDLVSIRAELPGGVRIEALKASNLPSGWRSSPPPESLKRIGSSWLKGGSSLVFQVPSAVVPAEPVFLLNPLYPDFSRLRVHPPEPFQFDPRLFKASRS